MGFFGPWHTGPEPNPNQIGGFNDPEGFHTIRENTGFDTPFAEPNSNQVDHFVAYIQASYYATPLVAAWWLWDEEHSYETADWALGVKGIFVGSQLRLYANSQWPVSALGFRPDEVGWYIRKVLADPNWKPTN